MSAVPKRNYIRSDNHRKFVAQHTCVVCTGGRLVDACHTVSQAAHLRENQAGGMSFKPCDSKVVPLGAEDRCGHHAEHDRSPNKFRLKYGFVDLDKHAYVLALQSPDQRIRDKAKETA